MSILFTKNYQRIYGTYPLKGDEALEALAIAFEVGYRSIDTAQIYHNEAEVGEAVANSAIARNELCITTKVTPGKFSEDKFIPSVEESLQKLRLDYVDLLLLHWPPSDYNVIPSLELLAEAKEQGLAKYIGISNYTAKMMEDAANSKAAPIDVNQVEFHPLLDQSKLLETSNRLNIPLSAYCSVARGEVFKYPEFATIGEKHNKTAGQVVLRWIMQKGAAPITKAATPENIKNNYAIDDFELSDEEITTIDKLNKTNYRVVTRSIVSTAPDWD